MFVMLEGEADILVRGRLVETVKPGGILGEMALVDAGPRSASGCARTDCKVIPVDVKSFTFLLQRAPLFALHLMDVMAGRLRRANQQL